MYCSCFWLFTFMLLLTSLTSATPSRRGDAPLTQKSKQGSQKDGQFKALNTQDASNPSESDTMEDIALAVYTDLRKEELANQDSCGPDKYLSSTGRCESCKGLCQTNLSRCMRVCVSTYVDVKLNLKNKAEHGSQSMTYWWIVFVIACTALIMSIVAVGCVVCTNKRFKSSTDPSVTKQPVYYSSESDTSVSTNGEQKPLIQESTSSRKQTVSTGSSEVEASCELQVEEREHSPRLTAGKGLNFVTQPTEDFSSQITQFKDHNQNC